MDIYGSVLAEIHDKWFDSIAKAASRHIKKLAADGKKIDLLDLGCGGGLLLHEVEPVCQRLFGSDISQDMIKIARSRVPSAILSCEGIFDAKLPKVDVITMVGEILSYAAAPLDDPKPKITDLFRKIFGALNDGGVFVFDVLAEDQDFRGTFFHDTENWTVHSRVTQSQNVVSRDIVSFIRRSEYFQKSHEKHDLRCFSEIWLDTVLMQVGFKVARVDRYDDIDVLPGRLAFECRKGG